MVEAKKDSTKEMVPEISIGLMGHVDHGKTTLTQALSGKWTDVHSEELKRGITIRLGYADSVFYKCPKCKDVDAYSPLPKCSNCDSDAIPLRKVSFIDAALLLVSANEDCPQPQTREHLMALEIMGIKDIIIVQNKVDIVAKEDLIKNHEQIKKFLKGTIAENSPIIPISAQHNINIDVLIQTIQEQFKTPKRNSNDDPLFYIARSFDVNKPGILIKNITGGVLGGAMSEGILKVGETIEIRPGLKKEKHGKTIWEPIITEISGMITGDNDVKEITPGGSAAIQTKLDPALVKTDSLVGNVIGLPGHMPKVLEKLKFKPVLLERVVGAKDDLVVEPIKKGETLMLNVNATATVGFITDLKKDLISLDLKKPVCASKGDRITLSRMIGARWRLIGYGNLD